MADNVTVDNGGLTDYVVSSDEAVGGQQIQRVKLCYSADGSETHITADADGLLVNLGAQNDVTVTGTVTCNAGTNLNTSLLATESTLSTLNGKVTTCNTGAVVISSGSVTADTELPSAGALADNTVNPTTTIVGAFLQIFDGSTWDRAPGNSVDGLLVNLGANNDVGLNAGTNYVGKVRITDGTNDITVDTVHNDAENNSQNHIDVSARLYVYNGTTWDRARDADATRNSTATGLLVSQLVAQFDDVAVTSVTENNFGNLRMSANRNMYTTIRDAAGNERGVNVTAGNALSVSIDASTASNISTNIAQMNGVAVTMGNGTSGTGVQRVTIASDSTGTVAVTQATASNLNCTEAATFTDDAAFTIASSKTKAVGGYAAAHGSAPDAADAGDAGVFLMNRHRVLWTIGGHPNLQSAEYYSSGTISDDNIMPLISAGTKYVITQISVISSAATVGNVSVRIGFGATTLPSQGATNADAVTKMVLSHPGIPPGSGIVKGNGAGVIGIGGDGEELRVTIGSMTSGSVIIQVDYFTIES